MDLIINQPESVIASYSKIMPVLTRSQRNALEREKLNIDENSDELLINNDSINRAVKNGYIRTVSVVRYLLDECDRAKYEEDRTACIEKVFKHLIDNPTILIYEPHFRMIIKKKMDDMEKYLNARTISYKNADYEKAIDMMRASMRIHIHNSKMRECIFDRLDDIKGFMSIYTKWSSNTSLRTYFEELRTIMEDIKHDAHYVVRN